MTTSDSDNEELFLEDLFDSFFVKITKGSFHSG